MRHTHTHNDAWLPVFITFVIVAEFSSTNSLSFFSFLMPSKSCNARILTFAYDVTFEKPFFQLLILTIDITAKPNCKQSKAATESGKERNKNSKDRLHTKTWHKTTKN